MHFCTLVVGGASRLVVDIVRVIRGLVKGGDRTPQTHQVERVMGEDKWAAVSHSHAVMAS